MPRSSRSISLALLSSAAFLAGCSRPQQDADPQATEGADWGVASGEDPSEDGEWAGRGGEAVAGSSGSHHRPIFIPVPIGGGGRVSPGGNFGPGGVQSSPGGTSRGGFGSTGHSASS